MLSGRLENTIPASSATLTCPWSTVRPSTNDSGMPSSTEPSMMASGDPAPPASLPPSPPPGLSIQSPAVNTAAPVSTSRPTAPTDRVLSASSMSPNETEPSSRPVPSAMTRPISARTGRS